MRAVGFGGALVLACAVALALGLAGCGGSGDVVETSLGRDVYLQRCVGCHGADGSGITGPDIRPENVLEKYATAEGMAAVVRNGLGDMPEFGSKLSDAEVDAVVAYVRGGLGG